MSNKIYISVLIILCSVFVFSWYRPGFIIGGAEEGLSFANPKRTFELFQYTWEEIHYGTLQTTEVVKYPSNLFFLFLHERGIPSDFLQVFVFFFLITTSAIFIYLLAKEIFNNQQFLSLIAAAFYIFNSFMFFNIWHRFLAAMFFFQPLLPISVYLFYKALKTNNILYLSLFLLSSFIFSTAFSLPSNVLTLWIILVILFFSIAISSKQFLKNKFHLAGWFLLFLVTWVLTNLWWLIPLNYQLPLAYSQVFGKTENINTLRSISSQFPFFTTVILGYKSMFSIWQTLIGILMLTIIGIGYKQIKIEPWKKFLLFTVLLSIFVLNGSNFPTGKIFEFFFERISQLQLFRNPYEKFGITLVFVYSILFSSGIGYLSKISRYFALFLTFLVFGLLFIPFWIDGTFGDKEINFYVSVPDDYITVNELLNQDTDEYRILSLPLLVSGGSAYNWRNKYSGTHPNLYLFDKPSLDGLVLMKEPDRYWRVLREGFYNGKISHLLKFANIKYLLLHKDIDTNYSQAEDTQTTLSYLQSGVVSNSEAGFFICFDLGSLQYYLSEGIFFKDCMLDPSNSNWLTYNFLHFEINSKSAGQLRIDIVDKSGQRLVFDGKTEERYRILDQEADKYKSFTLNLKVPSEKYSGFSSLNIDHLEFYFVPNNKNLNNTVTIKKVYLDEGKKIPNDYWKKFFSTPNLELYTVSNQYFYPRIYAAKDLFKINNWEQLLETDVLPEAFYLDNQQKENINYNLVLEKPEINFKKLNNTKYAVSIKNVKSPFWLIFSETFSTDWVATLGDREFPHFPVNGFANGYFIDYKGSYMINLEYKRQVLADKFRNISLVFFIVIALVGFFIRFAFKRKQILD